MLLLSLSVVVAIPPVEANISNDGNYAVQVEIKRKRGSPRRTRIYPGQAIVMPDNATEVRIPGGSFKGHGDETILVTIVESDGTVGTITELGGSFKLNQADSLEVLPVKLVPGSVKNSGNIHITVHITKENGKVVKRRLYPTDEYTLAKDVVQVEVVKDRTLRGDEIIKVQVQLPDKTRSTIAALGGIFKIVVDEPFELQQF